MSTRQSDMEDHVFEDPYTLQRQRLLNPRRTGISRSTRLFPMRLRNAVENRHLRRLREQFEAAKGFKRRTNRRKSKRRTVRRPARRTKCRTKCRKKCRKKCRTKRRTKCRR